MPSEDGTTVNDPLNAVLNKMPLSLGCIDPLPAVQGPGLCNAALLGFLDSK
jgi:hypothetical protein